jgi:hydrogenase expression/formation protein HypE
MSKVGDIVEISHGGGGKRMDTLIEFMLQCIHQRTSKNVVIGSSQGDDGAFLNFDHPIESIVMTTDSHTVSPLFFKGGNIGDLSIAGTINDVVVMGAEPKFFSLGVVIEEGFSMSELATIFETIGSRVEETGISIATGDTKVMPKGSMEGLVTNTTGIGVLVREQPLAITDAKVGDKIIISGTIGDHGASLMSQREGIDLDTDLNSDVSPFWPYFRDIVANPDVHVMKDLTRGGLASALNDIARASQVLLEIEEDLIPIRDETQAVCDILGLEVMEISSEGKAIIIVESNSAEGVLHELHRHELSRDAKIIGSVKANPKERVHVVTDIGGTRILDKPYGEPIPRVC